MRVIFLGTPEFAAPSLRTLLHSTHEVCAVFTQPDRPAGRGQKPHAPVIKEIALDAKIPVFQPEKIRLPENQPLIESWHADVIVVAAYGQILPGWLLRIPRLGCVNVHASLLPKYRGAAPVNWAILNGEDVTGVTTMQMDEHLDTGPMLLKREVKIDPVTTAGELAARLANLGADLLLPTLEGLESETLKPLPQDDGLASLAPRITKEMARIDWNAEAHSIHNRIRGLNPWPLAWSDWNGVRIQFIRSEPPADAQAQAVEPATFLGGTGQGGINIACGGGSILEILEVQPEGKRRMTARDYANGARLKPGHLL